MSHAAAVTVGFRFDASVSIGRGHLQRCTALAVALKSRGATISGALCAGDTCLLSAEAVATFPALHCINAHEAGTQVDATRTVSACRERHDDVLILDSFRVDPGYQQYLLRNGIRWLQFDSLAQHPLHADWVLHASPGADPERYEALRQRPETEFLLGPRYAVLHPGFWESHTRRRLRTGLSRIAICLGGADDGGALLRVLHALRDHICQATHWDVIVGSTNKSLAEIEILLRQPPYASSVSLHIDTPDIAEHFLAADLGILTGGTVSYEAAALGLPMLLLSIADNQDINAAGWASRKAAIACGSANDCASLASLPGHIERLASDNNALQSMSQAAMNQIDGRGALRVADAILGRADA